uniref:Large ribosomal subunit protein mL54 n=1 Tax=Alona affinis TaxID=381656 RepID=A0A9N6WT31_9CRUS|nr:EOG090X0KWJ [Alona affinis]
MVAMAWRNLFTSRLLQINASWNVQIVSGFAKPAGVPGALGTKKAGKAGKLGPIVEKKILPVETDPEKLVNFLCVSKFLKQGEDIKLKPDNEYPDWLWTLRIGKAPPLEEMDPNSLDYWKKVVKLHKLRNNRLRALKRY